MIDFHNHILPATDDGSPSMEVTLSMLRTAADQGITDIVNTVHFQSPRMDRVPVEIDALTETMNQVRESMKNEGINIQLHLGAEVFYLPNLMELIKNPLLTFGRGKYMLIEFSTRTLPESCWQMFFDLNLAGITPIIAHPERYKKVQENPALVGRFIRSGCLIQLDAGSLIGTLGESSKKASLEILRQGLCHIIGSDAHDDRKRNFQLAEAVEIAVKYLGEDIANQLVTTNPKAVLDGEYIEPGDGEYHEPKRSFWSRLQDYGRRK